MAVTGRKAVVGRGAAEARWRDGARWGEEEETVRDGERVRRVMRMRRKPARRRRAAAPAMRGSGEWGWGAAVTIVTVREAVVRAVRERWVVPATEAWTWRG
jgi:hypothetical protein